MIKYFLGYVMSLRRRKMRKKLLVLVGLIGLVLFLSGCAEIDQEITAESDGIWNKYFVYPLSWVIVKVAEFFHADYGYGLSIVIVTLIIRLILLPLNIKQLKSSKAMQQIQPELQKKFVKNIVLKISKHSKNCNKKRWNYSRRTE